MRRSTLSKNLIHLIAIGQSVTAAEIEAMDKALDRINSTPLPIAAVLELPRRKNKKQKPARGGGRP